MAASAACPTPPARWTWTSSPWAASSAPRRDPVLPHPRMHERGFVLAPLLDVAPEWTHPVLSRTARDLLAMLPDQGVRPIPA